jgi:hypothetical protein
MDTSDEIFLFISPGDETREIAGILKTTFIIYFNLK